ncbi:small ribosomal subunit Rsm22 family protein [Streptomyces sp. NBC_01803]|uniref:small ribosomal subunit Rsm22 family protein n=1 Tax=Streptomyces sp. NBC_01803 TaxID=2975946 RepID=UPI002DDAFA22|nr:small ribosomal subunit Rsm22 family protein [Streptomyces sp. NBC_01803]WSA47718.1 small ribosomal subunit Rsm22 family protein [Streptomyces sp. NBC_01803]
MPPIPASEQLRVALDRLLDGLPPRRAASAVERLMAGYRGRTPAGAPVLRDRADAVAYAAYRMPATFGAVSAALRELAGRLPGWEPGGHLDVGGGTGAAIWAAAGVWPAADRETVVLDRAGPALDLGRELAGLAADGPLRTAEWRLESIGATPPAIPALPLTDLVTVSYVLGELPEAVRDAVVDAVARAGAAVVLVEPGTPDGYLRIRAARDRLIAAGLRVLAPCPHDGECPITVGSDWCHFAARVSRSALHRRVKGGVLPYEDEKFSYVAAVRPGAEAAPEPAAARIVRRPLLRKGQVLLELCARDDGLRRATVSKRQGPGYRAARDAGWGEPWPPQDSPPSPAAPVSPVSPDYPSEPVTGQDVRHTRGRTVE